MKKDKTQKANPKNPLGRRIINPKPLKSTFAPVENWLLENADISFGAMVLYARLVQFANKDGVAWPTREQLAKALNVSTDQIDRYSKELVNCGLIYVEKRGLQLPNLYYFLYHPWMDELPSSVLGNSEAANMRPPEAANMRPLEAANMQTPLNKRTEEKNKEKNTHREESVCVSQIEVSEYTLEEWTHYAENQPNIKSPKALARELAKDKKNDPCMKQFRLEQEKLKTQELKEQEEKTKSSPEVLKVKLEIENQEQEIDLGKKLYSSLTKEEKQKLINEEWMQLQKSEHLPKYKRMPEDKLIEHLAYQVQKKLVSNFKESQATKATCERAAGA